MELRSALGRRAPIVGICAAALVATAASLVTAAYATPSRSSTRASMPRCATAGLVVWLDTRGSGAAGSTFYKLEFTNLSGHACTLIGYPGVSAVDLAAHRLGRAASRNSVHRARLVTLANGATASAVLQVVDVLNFPRSVCRPTRAAGLRVFPPNQTVSKLVPFPLLACSRSGPAYLSVQVVQKTL
jgi:hypothetical protein